jgi:hypothetical protein
MSAAAACRELAILPFAPFRAAPHFSSSRALHASHAKFYLRETAPQHLTLPAPN